MTDFEGAQMAVAGQRVLLDQASILHQALVVDQDLLNRISHSQKPIFTPEQR